MKGRGAGIHAHHLPGATSIKCAGWLVAMVHINAHPTVDGGRVKTRRVGFDPTICDGSRSGVGSV